MIHRKDSTEDNAVLPVLFLNTLFTTLIFSPFILDGVLGTGWFTGTFLDNDPFAGHPETSGARNHSPAPRTFTDSHKSVIVLSSWVFGYFGMKHLPLTIVGPINATRPVLVLIGALLIFGERLNAYQWTGVLLSLVSIFLLNRSSKKEHVDFRHDKWIWCIAAAAIIGAVSGLYDKYILGQLGPMFVQSWYNLYQLVMMGTVCIVLYVPEQGERPLRSDGAIPPYIHLPFPCRFRLFHCTEPAGFHDFRSISDPQRVSRRFICLRRTDFQKKNLKAKGHGPASDHTRNDFHLDRI